METALWHTREQSGDAENLRLADGMLTCVAALHAAAGLPPDAACHTLVLLTQDQIPQSRFQDLLKTTFYKN